MFQPVALNKNICRNFSALFTSLKPKDQCLRRPILSQTELDSHESL